MSAKRSIAVGRDPNFQSLSATTQKEMKRLKVPGVALGIFYEGKEHTAGFGITSVEHALPVTADTLFQVASITKTFTATVLMMLVEQGKVNLDAPVRRYLHDFRLRDKDVERRVTVRQLLTHMGGWVGDYFNDFGNGDDALDKMVKRIAKLSQVQPVGTIWSYNNTGFQIAARIIETVSRKPYERAVQEMLLDPIGLKMTFFYPSDVLFTHRFVVGHYNVKGQVLVARPWAVGRAANGVGGIVSTVRDLLEYARFHMSNGRKGVITGRSLRAMRVPQADVGNGSQMGITWFISRVGNVTLYEHGGSSNGQKAFLFFIPKKKFALAILTNSENGGIINTRIVAEALKLYFGAESKRPRPILVPVAELEPYTGRYRIGISCFDIKLHGKYLVYHDIPLGGFPAADSPPLPAMPPVRLLFYEADKVVGLDEPLKGELGEFLRNEKGKLEYLRIRRRAHKKIT